MHWITRALLCVLPATFLALAPSARADVVIAKDGAAQAAIYVAPEVMKEDAAGAATLKNPAKEAELQRQRLRDSVKDLAAYLEKISGAKLAINPPAASPAAPVRIVVGDL